MTGHALGCVLSDYLYGIEVRGKVSSLRLAGVHAGHLSRHFGDRFDCRNLDADAVDGFVAERLAYVKPVSVNGSLKILRAALGRGGYPSKVRLLRESKALPAILTPLEQTDLLARAPAPLDLILLLALDAGLRHAEILHLVAADVRGDEVRVTAKVGWSPKSHCERAVPCSQRLRVRLDELGTAQRPDQWLFPGLEGSPRVSVDHLIRPLFAGFDSARKPGLHMCRRTWATRLAGVTDIETVRQLGGWADLATVQRYVTSTDERKRAAIAALETPCL